MTYGETMNIFGLKTEEANQFYSVDESKVQEKLSGVGLNY